MSIVRMRRLGYVCMGHAVRNGALALVRLRSGDERDRKVFLAAAIFFHYRTAANGCGESWTRVVMQSR